MKLTEKRLKEIILEEIEQINELTADVEMDDSTEKKTFNTGTLKGELLALSQQIQSIKNLDATEIKLISGIIAKTTELSSKGNAGAALQRAYDILEKA